MSLDRLTWTVYRLFDPTKTGLRLHLSKKDRHVPAMKSSTG